MGASEKVIPFDRGADITNKYKHFLDKKKQPLLKPNGSVHWEKSRATASLLARFPQLIDEIRKEKARTDVQLAQLRAQLRRHYNE